MLFAFPSVIQAGLASGQYEVVKNAAGVALGIARDKTTGQFVGQAVGILGSGGLPLNPITVPLQFTQMYQMHRGFQAVQASLGVLQTMTAITGVGVVANLAVSAVSLWQVLKLREDVRQQRIEMRDGFLDIKRSLQGQTQDIIQAIQQAVQDVEFQQHHLILAQAYGRFMEATRLMKTAMACDEVTVRNGDLANARQILKEALADYKNPHFLPDMDTVTKLRRFECVWTIEQSIAATYELQDEPNALNDCLVELEEMVCDDLSKVINECESDDELNIIFPEITRIHDHDLTVLNLWQEKAAWMKLLSASEKKSLQSLSTANDVGEDSLSGSMPVNVYADQPREEVLYETQKQKSHFLALRDSLGFLVEPSERDSYENYIHQQAQQFNYSALDPSNLKLMSNLSVANLYWYFQFRDESDDEVEDEEMSLQA